MKHLSKTGDFYMSNTSVISQLDRLVYSPRRIGEESESCDPRINFQIAIQVHTYVVKLFPASDIYLAKCKYQCSDLPDRKS